MKKTMTIKELREVLRTMAETYGKLKITAGENVELESYYLGKMETVNIIRGLIS